MNNFLKEKDYPDTLKQEGHEILNLDDDTKIVFLCDNTNNIIKSLYYQGILTHYWLFTKGISYNLNKEQFEDHFAEYQIEKTEKEYIIININNTNYIIKTYGYKLIFKDLQKMNNIYNIKNAYSPCVVIHLFRCLFEQYFDIKFKYMLFPKLTYYHKRIRYYRKKGGEEFKKFMDEYNMKYEEMMNRSILEIDETIYQKIVK